MTAWLRLHGDPPNALGGIYGDVWGPSSFDSFPLATGNQVMMLDTWYQVTWNITSNVQIDHLSIRLIPNTPWTGTLYIDGVTFSGP